MELFPQITAAVRANIRTLELAAAQVHESLHFRCCLGLILRVGNLLNRGTPRANAHGFEVHVLPSLAAIKSSRDTQYSLLHYVARDLKREVDAEVAREAEEAAEAEATARRAAEAAANAQEGRGGAGGDEVGDDGRGNKVSSPIPCRCTDDGGSGGRRQRHQRVSSWGGDVPSEVKELRTREHTRERAPGTAPASAGEAEAAEGEDEALVEAEEAAVLEAAAQEGAVLQLRHELRLLPDAKEATELLGSIEVQISHMRSELYQARDPACDPARDPARDPTRAICHPVTQCLNSRATLPRDPTP